MPGSEWPSRPVVADTVVVNYFLALGRFGLLAQLAGGRIYVPRAVYDPDDGARDVSEGLSELEMGLRRHRRRAADQGLPSRAREQSKEALPHFEELPNLVRRGQLVLLELTPAELKLYSDFRDHNWARRNGLVTGLGAGEAAALVVSESRGMQLATDDQDCIRIAVARRPGMSILRIRRLLEMGVEARLISLTEAKSIHLSMVAFGFRDTGRL